MAKTEETGVKPGKAAGKMRKGKAAKAAKAVKAPKGKVTFNLEPEVLALAKREAKTEGRELGHFLQKAIESYLVSNVPAEDALVQRLNAKRAVLDKTVATALELNAAGKFDEHFILTVIKTASADSGFAASYDQAINTANEKGVNARKARLNRQLGRMILRAAGAQAKRAEDGKPMRAQVSDELITSYTLVEKAA